MTPLPDGSGVPAPGEKKSPTRLARGTELAVGVRDADSRRPRPRHHRVHRSVPRPAVSHDDDTGNASVRRGDSALDGRAGPAVTQDGQRPRRRSLPRPGYAVRADR